MQLFSPERREKMRRRSEQFESACKRLFADSSVKYRPGIFYDIVNQRNDMPVEHLVELISSFESTDAYSGVQEALIRACRQKGSAIPLKHYVNAFRSTTDPNVRWLCVEHMRAYPHQDVLEEFTELASDEYWRERYAELSGRSL